MKHLQLIMIALCLVVAGCSNRPADFPGVLPCKVIVQKDGQPLSEVNVSLYKAGGNGTLSYSGVTDSGGVAEIQTQLASYKHSGAPAGTYKVTIEKPVDLPPSGIDETQLAGKELDDYMAKRQKEIEKLRVMPEKYALQSTTPVEISVAEGNAEHKIDVTAK